MKKIILIILFLSIFTSSYSQWHRTSRIETYGGLTTDLEIMDGDIYIGTVYNGLYKSTNIGKSWSYIGFDTVSVREIEISNGNIYIGTSFNKIFRSTDNGNTWVKADEGLDGYYLYSIAASGDTVYTGSRHRINFHRSYDAGKTWQKVEHDSLTFGHLTKIEIEDEYIVLNGLQDGLVYSPDRGKTWKKIEMDSTVNYKYNFELNKNELYVYIANALLYTNNFGDSWDYRSFGLDSIDIYTLYYNNGKLYASANNSKLFISEDKGLSWEKKIIIPDHEHNIINSIKTINDSIFVSLRGQDKGFYISSDNGDTWEKRNTGIYGQVTAKDLINENGAIIAGIAEKGIFKTTDNGESWITLKDDIKQYNIDIEIEDGIYFSTSHKGIWRSEDLGETWNLSNSGLKFEEEVYTIKAKGDTVFASTDKGIFRSTDKGLSWTSKNNGYSASIPVIDFAFTDEYVFAGSLEFGVYFSSDGGELWQSEVADMEDTRITSLCTIGSNVFAGTLYGGVYQLSENMNKWIERNHDISDHSVNQLYSEGENLYAATNGGVSYSSDLGKSWKTINEGFGDDDPRISSLTSNEDMLFTGFEDNGIYKVNKSYFNISDVKDAVVKGNLTVFPVPAQENITISAEAVNSNITVFNIFGEKVLETLLLSQNQKVDISELPKGVYFIRSGDKYGKFVKN